MSKKIRCKLCGDVLQSMYTHDFKMCKCESCFIDGGDDYYRIGGEPENWEFVNEEENI